MKIVIKQIKREPIPITERKMKRFDPVTDMEIRRFEFKMSDGALAEKMYKELSKNNSVKFTNYQLTFIEIEL